MVQAVRTCADARVVRGHDKFLRQIGVVLDITAPLYWWKQMDTYKVGTVAQSESTMHTLLKNPITNDCFESGKVPDFYINFLEDLRQDGDFVKLNAWLPQSWLQRRIWTGNYAVLKNIILQRENHKLPEWKFFFDALLPALGHPELLPVKYPFSRDDTTEKASADETLSGKG